MSVKKPQNAKWCLLDGGIALRAYVSPMNSPTYLTVNINLEELKTAHFHAKIRHLLNA